MADENVTVQRVKLLESDLPKMVVKGWLSPRTSFVVTIDGPFAAKEGAALLRLLGAQLDVLADGVTPCGSHQCIAGQRDGVLCADGECDRENGVRPDGVPDLHNPQSENDRG